MRTRTFVLLASLPFIAASTVRGIGNDNPTGPAGSHNGEITTACSYDAYTGNGKRAIDDLVVTGALGAYPLKWTRVLNTRYVSGQGNGSNGSVGVGGWDYSFHWNGWVRFEPNPPPPCYGECTEYEGPDAHLEYPDGRVVDFYQDGSNLNVYRSWLGSEPGDRLVRDLSDNGWDLKLKDGGKVHFAPTGNVNTVSLSAQRITDPYGQTTNFERDGLGRLWRIVEPGGRFLQINYVQYWLNVGSGGYYGNFIRSVQAFGSIGNLTETVTYNYTQVAGPYTVYYLTQVDYDDASHAYYTYQSANAGSTGNPLIKTCNDVRYAGPMSRIEYVFEQAGASYAVAFGQVKAEKNVPSSGQAGQIVSQVQYPVFSPGYVPQPGNTTLQTRVETRGDGRSRTFLYGTGFPGNPPEGTAIGVLNTYTDFKNLQSELTRMTYGDSPVDVPNGQRTTIKAPLNRVTYVDRDYQTSVVKRVTFPTGHFTLTTYQNDTGLDPAPVYVMSQQDENGRITYYARDTNSHAVTKIGYGCDPNGPAGVCPTEEFTYNGFGQVLTHKLTTGGTESFEYDNGGPLARGLKTKWTDAMGNSTLYEYYTSGPHTDRLYKVTDPRTNATTFEYNLRGQVTKVIHPDTYYTQSFYNPDGTLAWSADENHPGAATDPSQRTRWVYDDYKRVLTVTNPMNETTTNSYGLNPITWGDPLLHTTNNVKYTVSPGGKNVVYDYDENLRKVGQNVALNTPDVAHTGFEYDPFGNVIKITDPRGKETNFGYDSRDRQISMTNAIATDRNPITGHTMDWVYDGVGNKLKETRADNAFRTWEYELTNPMNRLTKAIDWRMSTAETPLATVYWRDLTSTQETTTDAKGAVYMFGFDYLHRKSSASYPTDATGSVRTETWDYDPAGNLKLYKNPAGQYKHLDYPGSYDSRNRLKRSAWNSSPSDNSSVNWAFGPEIRTDYDPASRITQTTTNNGQTTVAFQYDAANRKLWEDQTVAGSTTHRVQHDLDSDGNPLNTHVPGWVLNWHHYNQRNQMDQIQDGSGNPWINFSYDAAGNTTKRQAVYGGVNDSLNVPTQYYDGLNRPTMWENTGSADTAFARSWQQYDTVGRMTATWRELEDGKGERFTFNVRSQITKANYQADQAWTSNPQSPARTEDFAVNSLNRESVTDTAPPINGLAASYYNGIDLGAQGGQPVTQTDGTVNFAWNMASPAPGINGEWFSARWEGQVMPAYSQTYTFYTQSDDGVRLWVNGQLLVNDWNYHGTIENSGTITLVAGQKYSIKLEYFQGCCGDAISLWWSWPGQTKQIIPQNRLFVPPGGSYVTNTLNQYTKVGVRAVGYDGNFNITSFDGGNFVYNAQSQLVSGTKGTNTVQFLYDGLGRCLKRTTNGASVILAYDGWKPIAEWAGDGSYWGFRIYGSGPDEVVWHYDSRYGYFRVHSDVHGNVMALLGWGGEGVEKYTVDAFGKPKITDWAGNVRSQSAVANSFIYTGREWIGELGIYDYRNRMYLPELGRFLQTDPKGFDAGDMNLFRYCGDDPVDRSDPTGLSDVYLERDYDDRHAPGTYSVRDNGGRQVYRGRANENPFLPGELSNGVSPGEYRLLRRGNGWGPGFAAWHPAITGFNPHLKPGQPNSSYRNPALVHEKGAIPGRGDSSACITTDHEGLMATSNAMAQDEKVGKTTRLHITHKPITNVKRALLPESNKPRKSGDKGVSTDSQPQPQQPRALTAAEIDAAHQAVGVPSLAAEAINFAPGKP